MDECSQTPGLLYDPSNHGWNVDFSRNGVYAKPSEEMKPWTSPEGAQVLHPKEFYMDTMFSGVARSFQCGLYDETTRRLDASTSFELSIGADGNLSGSAGASMKKLMGNGERQIAYEYSLPCARLTHSSHVEHQTFSWVREVYLGARVQGFLSVKYLEDSVTQADCTLSAQADLNNGSLTIGGGMGVKSDSPPKCVSNRLTQDGGVRVSAADWESRDLSDLFRYLDRKWTEESLERAELWQILMIKVQEAKQDEIHVMSPHTVVLGRTGTGKSTFFNSLLGGRKDCTGRDHFRTSRSEGDEAKSCTRKPLSAVFQMDAVAGDANGDAHHVNTAFRFTDVPGFGATDLPDDRIITDLFLKLGAPECRRLHAIVWVERFDEVRFSADHLRALWLLEERFGPKLWDLMVVVLTSFPFPKKESKEKAIEEAQKLKAERSMQMKQAVIDLMPSAKNAWGDRQNMFYCVDSLDAVLSDEELQVMEEKEAALNEDDPVKGEAERRRRSRDYTQIQFSSLKLHMVANTRNNLFWDSCAHQDVVYAPPDNVVNLSQLKTHLHSFEMTSFLGPTSCDHCKTFLWGLNNQGQRCSDPQCGLTLCHSCAKESQSTYAGSSMLTVGSLASASIASAKSVASASVAS